MTDKMIVNLTIYTKGGTYTMPLVDMNRHVLALNPVLAQNPCLQVINEEHSVLSLIWKSVVMIEASYPSETNQYIWEKRVVWDSAA